MSDGGAPTILYLVRHGEVAARRRFYGHLDVELSEAGLQQLRCVADALGGQPVAAVISSDLSRALRGAELIAARHGLAARPDPAFREMSLGELEGLSWEEGQARLPELAAKRYRDMWSYRFPGGENLQDVGARMWPALERLIAEHAGKLLVLVAHNSINRLVLGRALGLPAGQVFDFDQDFGCVNRVRYDADGAARVQLLNWTPGNP
jgi:broad specificity phosphatase PhoE